MRTRRSRWPAWLALTLAVLVGGYSVLGVAMVGSFHTFRSHEHYRIAGAIYLVVFAVAAVVAVAAVGFLVRASRRSKPARNASVE